MINPKKALDNIIKNDDVNDIDAQKNIRLKLDLNENIYKAPINLLSVIKNISIDEISAYPSYFEVIQKIADKYKLHSSNVEISNGIDEIYQAIINAYLEFDEELLTINQDDYYIENYAKSLNIEVKKINLTKEDDFVFQKKFLCDSITPKTKIVYLQSPNFITGELIKPSTIKELLEEFRDILFVLDCSYISYCEFCNFEDFADLINDYDNIILIKSFSKDYGISGLRFCFVLANDNIIKNIKKIKSDYCVNCIALACLKLLINDEKTIEKIKESNALAKKYFLDELINLGFLPYKSEANFILCDFGPYSDFYYEKFKRNGVITKNFKKNSPFNSCLRITIPKLGAIKYILELLNKKDLLVCNLDGLVFDTIESSYAALEKTFGYFSNKKISKNEINSLKNLGSTDCDWYAIKYLLNKLQIFTPLEDIISVYRNIYRMQKLIDKHKLLIDKDVFLRLSEKYDFVIFSQKFKDDIDYEIKKYELDKYFYYFVTYENVFQGKLKPDSYGLDMIKKHCPYKKIMFLASNVDDVICANNADVISIGAICPSFDYNAMVNNYKHLGASYILSDIKNIEQFLSELD